MSIDLSSITGPMIQIKSLEQTLVNVPPGPAHDLIQAQIAMLTAQADAAATHAQAQADSQSTLLNTLGLVGTLTNMFGQTAPTIINMFK